MNELLNRNLFFVKEHVGIFKAANNYDILDPETKEPFLLCREPDLGIFTKIFRFTSLKTATPFNIVITDTTGRMVLRVKRGVTLWLSNVEVFDENEQLVGRFKQKLFSIGGKFNIFDANDQQICALNGKWTSWEFTFKRGEQELARVTKKWAGFGKELFTTADNYMLQMEEHAVAKGDKVRQLILAAVMCIDMVLKEN